MEKKIDLDKRNKLKKGALTVGAVGVGLIGLSGIANSAINLRPSDDIVDAGTAAVYANDLKINQHAYFDSEYANTVTTSACTVDWGVGNKQKLTLDANCAVTLTAPDGVGNFLLKLVQDGTGSRTVTWATTLSEEINWAGGTAPTLTETGGGIDIITFYYDGANYFGVASLAFAAP